MVGLLLDREPELARGSVLHFAPEAQLEQLLKSRAASYRSADLAEGKGDLVLDIEDLDLPDESIDTLMVSHILEHVDDSKALSELFRVLRPNGTAVILIPIIEGWSETYEDDRINDERSRDLHFGQWDHVRYYGVDVRNRIAAAGFTLEEFTGSPAQAARHGLLRGETIFLARKSSPR